MIKFFLVSPLIFGLILVGSQQMVDPEFDAKVARPTYTSKHPKVLIDEAHKNFHTAGRGYKPFANLLTNDGYEALPNKERFQESTLKGVDVLVIANALGAAIFSSDAGKPAFTDEECDAVRDWVRNGGALLLIADHAPIGAANEILASRFGVDMSKVHTHDTAHPDPTYPDNPGWILYSRKNGLLGDHPITRGRNESERIDSVTTFTGQSLKGPKGSVSFLKLADTAVDVDRKTKKEVSAAGRSQGIAMRFGKGRVIILGEAAMLTAQIEGGEKFGMNREGNNNKQLALNIMHWLSGLLK
jgi:hypothetical protein